MNLLPDQNLLEIYPNSNTILPYILSTQKINNRCQPLPPQQTHQISRAVKTIFSRPSQQKQCFNQFEQSLIIEDKQKVPVKQSINESKPFCQSQLIISSNSNYSKKYHNIIKCIIYQFVYLHIKIFLMISFFIHIQSHCSCAVVFGVTDNYNGFYQICQYCAQPNCQLVFKRWISDITQPTVTHHDGICLPAGCVYSANNVPCSTCKSGFSPSLSGGMAYCALDCPVAMPNCATCDHQNQCTSCSSPYFVSADKSKYFYYFIRPMCSMLKPRYKFCYLYSSYRSFLQYLQYLVLCIQWFLLSMRYLLFELCKLNQLSNLFQQLVCTYFWNLSVLQHSFKQLLSMQYNRDGVHSLQKQHRCRGDYFNSECQNCSIVFHNCTLCSQYTNLCVDCDPKFYLNSSSRCQRCSPMCLECNSSTVCTICHSKAIKIGNLCKFYGCVSYLERPNKILECVMCNKFKYFQRLPNQTCSCIAQFNWDQTQQKCIQKCGDGKCFQLQCDDGNLINGDGCNSNCQIQNSFGCTVTKDQTYCKYIANLKLQVQNIMKNQDNSAVITLRNILNIQPFPFQDINFINSTVKQYFYLQLILSQNPEQLFYLETKFLSAYANQINIQVDFDFNIQGYKAKLKIDTSDTRYKVTDNQVKMKIDLKGKNNPLKIKKFGKMEKALSAGFFAISIASFLTLFIGLFSIKYIGLECILTLQLIYYSQLLITPSSKWPSTFGFLKYLQYANGYNNFFQLSAFVPSKSYEIKVMYMEIYKTVIQNYNTSFLILLLIFITFIVFFAIVYTKNNQIMKEFQDKNNNKQNVHEKTSLMKNIRNQLGTKIRFLEIVYRIITQISTWSILQMMSALSVFIMISNKYVKLFQEQNMLIVTQGTIIMSAFVIVFMIGLNFAFPMFLHRFTLDKLSKRPQQQKYKFINFIYLFVIGSLIFFFNQFKFYSIPISLITLLVHLFYLIYINFVLNPYCKSLRIHRRGLLFNHVIYLIFLFLINIINFMQDISEQIIISFGFGIAASCVMLITATIMRLYYQYRYGQALELKIQKQEELQELKKKQEQKQRLLFKRKFYQMQAKRKLQKNLSLSKRLKNQYIYQNQILQQDRQSYLTFLQNKQFIDNQQLQKLYFMKFDRKPLKWLKQNQADKYNKIINQSIVQRNLVEQRRNNNEQFKMIRSKLKNQLVEYEIRNKYYKNAYRNSKINERLKQRLQF